MTGGPAAWGPEDAHPEHWSGTESAQIVATLDLRQVAAGIASLDATGGVMVIDGAPGLGKTFALKSALQRTRREIFWITMPHEPRGKETSARVHQTLTGRRLRLGRITEYELLEDNLDLLRNRDAVLAIDEGQHLTRASLSQLRYLFDLSGSLLLVIAGADVHDAMSRKCPELVNRADRHVPFEDLTAAATRDAMRAYHPVFRGSSPEGLSLLYRAAGGIFRNWARLLKAALAVGFTAVETPEQAATLIHSVWGSPAHRHRTGRSGRAA